MFPTTNELSKFSPLLIVGWTLVWWFFYVLFFIFILLNVKEKHYSCRH